MIARQGSVGRLFVLRLEDGDRLPDSIEDFAASRGIARACCWLVGGAGNGVLVVGPADAEADKISPMLHDLENVHEAAAVGTIFPDQEGRPKLHMHAALGRGSETRTGCVRQGVDIWRIAECVILEITDNQMSRKTDPAFGFEVLSD
jgi:predicted DNA-binding protein with PD1-like motif